MSAPRADPTGDDGQRLRAYLKLTGPKRIVGILEPGESAGAWRFRPEGRRYRREPHTFLEQVRPLLGRGPVDLHLPPADAEAWRRHARHDWEVTLVAIERPTRSLALSLTPLPSERE